MHAPFARPTLFIALALVGGNAFAARGVLRANGILRVKGADISSTSITVVPERAPSYSLPIGTKHFTLDLPLDDVYLISVARAGCPTKEIYLDTRVPAEMHAMEFQFPFMVTLEYMTPERMFAYAGPVGFVRYQHRLRDFGYETEYVAQVDEDLRNRMDAVRETGVDPKVMLPILLARVVDRPRGEYNASAGHLGDSSPGILAPMVSEVPPMVHVVTPIAPVEPATPKEIPEPVSIGTMELGPQPALVPSAATTLPLTAPNGDGTPGPRSAIAVATATAIEPQAADSVPYALPEVATAAWVGASLRTEELIVEPRRLTRIVRYSSPSDHVNEFRMVTHAFGAVYYFHGMDSITERAFEEATAQVVLLVD